MSPLSPSHHRVPTSCAGASSERPARRGTAHGPRRRVASIAIAGAMTGALLTAGCASAPDAQWVDPQLAGKSFAGQKVLVVCDAYEAVVKQICTDELARQISERGGQPVLGVEPPLTSPWRPVTPTELLPAARQTGAKALLTAVVQPGVPMTQPGPSIGFGLGNFRLGGGGIGVGISAPIGAGRTETGYEANALITEVDSGRLLWTAKLSTGSGDMASQIATLAKRTVQAAGKAGLL